MSKTNLVVVGAGPGGYVAAFLAADLGMDVTLVGKNENPGGVCLYRGCIPSKALLHVAKLVNESKESAEWGVEFSEPKIDLDKLRSWKNSVVEKLTGGLGQLAKARNVRYIRGTATFLSSTKLKVEKREGGEEELAFDKAILATGSVIAKIPSLDIKSDRLLDSTTALDLPAIPKSLLVIGGGYIGLELGSAYRALGAKVSVVEMTSGLLPGADRDLVTHLSKRIKASFEEVMLKTKVVAIEEKKDALAVTLESESGEKTTKEYDYALMSIGRKPTTDGFGLENTDVQTDERGWVKVDAQRRTTDENIYAIGDVAGEPMLAHKASHEGKVAVEAIAGEKAVYEPRAIPAVVFTDPELAWAGLSETEAKKQGVKVEVAKFPWAASGRATTLGRSDGVTKLVIDPETERVLGVGVCGPGAGELIAEGALAIEMAATVEDLKMTIHPHPTLSETVMEAADAFFGQSAHYFRPKRK
jgi:dihydrolipoamide dehydrogenase